MNKKLYILLTLVFLFTQTLSAQNEYTFSAKFRDYSDTIRLGGLCTVTYKIHHNLKNVRDLSFATNDDLFGEPIAIRELVGSHGSAIFAFIPKKTGVYKIPRAYFVDVEGNKHESNDLTIVVIEPKEELNNYNIKMQVPDKVKQYENFDITVDIDGEFKTVPAIYLHKVGGLKELDRSDDSSNVPYKIEKTDTGLKYYFRFRFNTFGIFHIPNALVWVPKDEAHYLSNSGGNIEAVKANPEEVIIKSIAPETAIAGEPFVMYFHTRSLPYNAKGNLMNISPDFGSVKEPLRAYIGDIMYVKNNDGSGAVDINELETVHEYAHVVELMAKKAGKYTLPTIKFKVNDIEYVSDTATITVLPNSGEEAIPLQLSYRHMKNKFIKNEELDLSLVISGSSFYLDDLDANINGLKKSLSENFKILDEKTTEQTLGEPYTRKAGMIKEKAFLETTKKYTWKLKASKKGIIALPPLEVTLNQKKYVLDAKDTITVKDKFEKEDLIIKYPKKTAINVPAQVVIRSEDGNLISLKMGSFDKAEMDTMQRVRFQSVLVQEQNEYMTYSLTYDIMPKKVGIMTVPSILVKTTAGDVYTDPITIEVLPADKNSAPTQYESYGQVLTKTSSFGKISPDDAFVRSTASATEVYQHQAVFVTNNLYTSLNIERIRSLATDLGEFALEDNNIYNGGSSKQDSILAKEDIVHLEGRNYKVYPLKRTLYFPPNVGQANMVTMTFNISFEVGGYKATEWESGDIKQPVITVKPLPAEGKPDSFLGLVGKEFNVKSEVLQGDSTILKVTVAGNGNVPILDKQNIKIERSSTDRLSIQEIDSELSFDRLSANGLISEVVKKYLIKSDRKGKHTIPAIEISYFNPDTKKYIIEKSNPVSFKID